MRITDSHPGYGTQSVEVEINPCPRCGGSNLIRNGSPEGMGGMSGTDYYIQCTQCWFGGPRATDYIKPNREEAKALAIQYWNAINLRTMDI